MGLKTTVTSMQVFFYELHCGVGSHYVIHFWGRDRLWAFLQGNKGGIHQEWKLIKNEEKRNAKKKRSVVEAYWSPLKSPLFCVSMKNMTLELLRLMNLRSNIHTTHELELIDTPVLLSQIVKVRLRGNWFIRHLLNKVRGIEKCPIIVNMLF